MFPTSLYRSPSQNKDQFDEFSSNFNMLMSNINDEKPIASIITGELMLGLKIGGLKVLLTTKVL